MLGLLISKHHDVLAFSKSNRVLIVSMKWVCLKWLRSQVDISTRNHFLTETFDPWVSYFLKFCQEPRFLWVFTEVIDTNCRDRIFVIFETQFWYFRFFRSSFGWLNHILFWFWVWPLSFLWIGLYTLIFASKTGQISQSMNDNYRIYRNRNSRSPIIDNEHHSYLCTILASFAHLVLAIGLK